MGKDRNRRNDNITPGPSSLVAETNVWVHKVGVSMYLSTYLHISCAFRAFLKQYLIRCVSTHAAYLRHIACFYRGGGAREHKRPPPPVVSSYE